MTVASAVVTLTEQNTVGTADNGGFNRRNFNR